MTPLALSNVDHARRAAVALDEAHRVQVDHQRAHRRPRAFSARDALSALEFEAMLLWTAMHNLRAGVELTPVDFDRITVAMARIKAICAEAV
jgi:hypothetical protein